MEEFRKSKGKEKETFQSWTKTKQTGGKVIGGNSSGDKASCAGKSRTGGRDLSAKPKGMKRSGGVIAKEKMLFRGEIPSKGCVDDCGSSKKRFNRIEQDQQRYRQSVQESYAHRGRNFAVMEDGKQSDGISGDDIDPLVPDLGSKSKRWRSNSTSENVQQVEEDVVMQRPVKEKTQTPSKSHGNPDTTPHTLENSGYDIQSKGRCETDGSLEESVEIKERSQGRGRVQSSKRGRQRIPSSDGSSGSESPVVPAQMTRGRGRQGRGPHRQMQKNSKGDVQYGSARTSPHEVSTKAHDSSAEETNEHYDREGGKRWRSASHERKGRDYEEVDYSEENQTSGSSAWEDRNKRESSNFEGQRVKAESVATETDKRRDRRRRQMETETERYKRERQGLKGHYISVDHRELPYGFGVGAWRQELVKLYNSLDPSVTNIRHQPKEAMATLRRRLKENFEYGAPIDRAYIRQLAGKCVTQRRSRLIRSLELGHACPKGFDVNIWRRLDRMRQDPNREALSNRMKNTNATRLQKGRTGPKGEEGINDDLYRALGREPDPDELHYEMQRNKGYSGIAPKRNKLRNVVRSPSSESKSNSGEENDVHGKSRILGRQEGSERGEYDVSYVKNMEEELQKLRSEMRYGKKIMTSEAMDDRGPSASMPADVEGSTDVPRQVEKDVDEIEAVDGVGEGIGQNPKSGFANHKKTLAHCK